MKELRFKLLTAVVPVTLETASGKTETLEIREMTAAARDHYLDGLSGRMRLGQKGEVTGVAKFEGLQSGFLACCLFRGDLPVSEQEIQSWPSSVVSELFNAAQELNRLGKNETAEAKND